MIRATTPTHTFTLPFGSDKVKTAIITYEQHGETILEKKKGDISAKDNMLMVTLTQEETLLFDAKRSVTIQLRVLTTGGAVLASQSFTVPCGRVLNEEVLV